jgi:NAD(P)H dehydrogenase (quinone)
MAIAVIGATGNTGRAVVKELRALGQNPVCVVRNADNAREVLGADAKTAVAELTDHPKLEKALASVQSVFVVTGTIPAWLSRRTLCSARRSKRHPISGTGRRQPPAGQGGFGIGCGPWPRRDRGAAQGKRRQMGDPVPGPVHAERAGPSGLDQDRQQDSAALRQDLPVALIDVRDTGAARARILIDPAPHAGKTYEFTGKLTTYGAFTEVFSAAQSLMPASRPSRPSRA